jgi:hypothetical protein
MPLAATAHSDMEGPMTDHGSINLISGPSEVIEDPILADLMEEGEWRSGADTDEENPFDLTVAKPRAIDIARLYELAERELPVEIRAALGPRTAIMLCHCITPFYKPGQAPTGAWGMGYTITIKDLDAATVSLSPSDAIKEVATLEQKLNVGIEAAGKLSVPNENLKLLNEIPGVSINGAEVGATNDTQFGLALSFSFCALKVQAGPVGAGGARWNLYRKGERIDLSQPLFHTLLIPSDTSQLNISIETWIRTPFQLFAWKRVRNWTYDPVEFEVSLQGLERETET